LSTATIDDIWLYIYEQGEVRTRDIARAFVATKRLSRGTMYKYKRLLEAEGKIQAKPVVSRPPHNVYYVPTRFYRQLEALKQYKQLASKNHRHIEQLDGFVSDSRTTSLDINSMKWEDAPEGRFFTKVQQKILWQNVETGAVLVLQKAQPGIAEAKHYHPDANQWAVVLSGECELPNGLRIPTESLFGYIPKGVPHIYPKITKESVSLVFYDGPRTKVET
jgi:hypothetical protein